MKLNVDKEADALYLRLDDSPIVESEEVSPGVVLDYNEANEVVGVEMLPLEGSQICRLCSSRQFERSVCYIRTGSQRDAAFTRSRTTGHPPKR